MSKRPTNKPLSELSGFRQRSTSSPQASSRSHTNSAPNSSAASALASNSSPSINDNPNQGKK